MLWARIPGRKQKNWKHALPQYKFPTSSRSVIFKSLTSTTVFVGLEQWWQAHIRF
jgi:hypothetical protein